MLMCINRFQGQGPGLYVDIYININYIKRARCWTVCITDITCVQGIPESCSCCWNSTK